MKETNEELQRLRTDDQFKEYLNQNPQINLIDDKGLAALRIKLGKNHRKESDWDIIKGILDAHNLIVMEPECDIQNINVIEHILCDDGYLMVFTNMSDAKKYIEELNERHCASGRIFQIGVMPFEEIIKTADYYRKNIMIDYRMEKNRKLLIYYWRDHSLKASIIL
jgi:hypothetical protein